VLGPRYTVSQKWLVVIVLLRTLFIPAYAAVAYSAPDSPSFLHGLVEFTVMIMFAFSHGYCSTVCMMGAPAAAGTSSDQPERQRAATIMTALTNVGIVIGAFVAFVWLAFPFHPDIPRAMVSNSTSLITFEYQFTVCSPAGGAQGVDFRSVSAPSSLHCILVSATVSADGRVWCSMLASTWSSMALKAGRVMTAIIVFMGCSANRQTIPTTCQPQRRTSLIY
jgi:hypothetical protein